MNESNEKDFLSVVNNNAVQQFYPNTLTSCSAWSMDLSQTVLAVSCVLLSAALKRIRLLS